MASSRNVQEESGRGHGRVLGSPFRARNEPFPARNYPEVPQPPNLLPYQTYKNWKYNQRVVHKKQPQRQQNRDGGDTGDKPFFASNLAHYPHLLQRNRSNPDGRKGNNNFRGLNSFVSGRADSYPCGNLPERPRGHPGNVDEPIFASNQAHSPEQPQPNNLSPYLSHGDWKEQLKEPLVGQVNQQPRPQSQQWQPQPKQQRPHSMEHSSELGYVDNGKSNLGRSLANNKAKENHPPGAQPAISSSATLSGVHLACMLLAAHLIQQCQDPNENCMLTHFSELCKYVVMSDDVQKVLKSCGRRNLDTGFTVPNIASPMARDMPQPPNQWLPTSPSQSPQ